MIAHSAFAKVAHFQSPTVSSSSARTSIPTCLTPDTTDTPSELVNRAENAALLRYVDSVRQHGHRAAKVDPLDLLERDDVAALDPGRYGLNDPEKTYNVDGILWNKQMPEGHDGAKQQQAAWKLRDIVKLLREVYVGRISYEFMHSPSKSERIWFTHLLESSHPVKAMSVQDKKTAWSLLARSETFDHFLQAKFPNLKRYGQPFTLM